MALSSEQKRNSLVGACFALRFLVHLDERAPAREQMAGMSDSAIFHRWMDLSWTLNEPDVLALLTPEEKLYVAAFNLVFESLPWHPLQDYPHISEVPDGDLSKLLASAAPLLESLERRTKPQTV